MPKQMSRKWRAADRRQSKRIVELRTRAARRRAAAGIEERPPRPRRREDEQ